MDPESSMFKNILEGKEELDNEKMQQMMHEWMQEAGQMEQMEEMNNMMKAWGDTWNEDAELKMSRDPTFIRFNQQNPYLDNSGATPVDLLARARELIEQG